MKFILPVAVLVLLLCALVFSLDMNNPELMTRKRENSVVKLKIKDLPDHGIILLPPSDPTFTKRKSVLVDPYSVLLKNSGSRSVVGYCIKWECSDGETNTPARDVSLDRIFSHIAGVVFLYSEESDRRSMLDSLDDVIKPHTTWLIANDYPARNIKDEVNAELNEAAIAQVTGACPVMTVTADGVFFDDGTFIGPDTTDFFARVKTQMDARYEILQRVRNELTSGKTPDEVFRGLEQIRDSEGHENIGDTLDELRGYFRKLFARDILGKKEVWGADKAIEEVQQMLSKPWVNLRKL
jgi:hypothetical protein